MAVCVVSRLELSQLVQTVLPDTHRGMGSVGRRAQWRAMLPVSQAAVGIESQCSLEVSVVAMGTAVADWG